MELNARHATVGVLRQMAPDATVGGGSFGHWLPHPSTIAPSLRWAAYREAQAAAVRKCLEDLTAATGERRAIPLRPLAGGPIQWAPGTVGSLTHKGTVVLGALTPLARLGSIGIDLELADTGDLSKVVDLVAPEGVPTGCDPTLGSLLSFSAKEAAFKAFFAVNRQPLEFSDIALDWNPGAWDRYSAVARCPRAQRYSIECRLTGAWLLSVAIPQSVVVVSA